MNNIQKPEILVVDDMEENLIAVEAILDNQGYSIVKARSGQDALAYLIDKEPALILLDVQMPEMDGFETAEILRNREKTRLIPIIFLTAISRDDVFVFKGYKSGAIDYLTKPINAEILKSKVRVFADLYRQKTELNALAEERALLIREVHHRVKNNLGLLINLIQLQKDNAKNQIVLDSLSDIEKRIFFILTIHDILYKTRELQAVSFDDYLYQLLNALLNLSGIAAKTSSFHLDCRIKEIHIDHILYFGLLLTELVLNTLKYGVGEKSGEPANILSVSCYSEDKNMILEYRDFGNSKSDGQQTGLGSLLIESMVAQLKGSMILEKDSGYHYLFRFPLAELHP